ncbi:MAG TPA: carboxylesterase family protein, partial [Acetobacteraceae bacterium]
MANRGSSLLATTTALFGLLCLIAGIPQAGNAAETSGPVVHTKEGPVQGFAKNGISSFLGIPYAAPPVGDLRWRPPQPHAAWTNTLGATKFA